MGTIKDEQWFPRDMREHSLSFSLTESASLLFDQFRDNPLKEPPASYLQIEFHSHPHFQWWIESTEIPTRAVNGVYGWKNQLVWL